MATPRGMRLVGVRCTGCGFRTRWRWRMNLHRCRHECWPPEGVVFEPTWRCPECGAEWRLEERANHSEWRRVQ